MSSQPWQIVSVILAIHCQSKYLLVQRKKDDEIFPGKWQNPGGKIELGERVEEAVKREIKEETGLKADVPPIFIQSYSWKKEGRGIVRLGLIFLLNLKGKMKDYRIKLNPELADYGWFSVQEAKKLDLIGKNSPTGTFKQFIEAEKWLKKNN